MNTKIQGVEPCLKAYLQNQFASPEQRALIDRHWPAILDQACTNLGEDSADSGLFSHAKKVQALLKELDQIIVGIETHGIFPYSSTQTEQNQEFRNIIKYLLHNIDLDGKIVNRRMLEVLSGKSPEQQSSIVSELQTILLSLFDLIEVEGRQDDPIIEMLIGQILCLMGQLVGKYAIGGVPSNNLITIPRKIDGSWKLVDYELELIPLNPAWIGEVIEAIGLTPLDPLASPILLYRGTKDALSFLSDATPALGVGELLYWTGRAKIEAWIERAIKEFPNRKIQVFGVSLGGALAYHTAVHYPEHVEIHAYVPPGVHARNLTLPEGVHIQGKIFIAQNDFVSMIGKHPEGPELIKVIRGKTPNFVLSHMRCFGGEETLLLRVNTHWENRKRVRKTVSTLHAIASPFVSLGCSLFIALKGIRKAFM